MKKIFVLACLLALVAIMAVPMVASAATAGTGTTTVGGTIAEGSITVVAPGAIAFGTLSKITVNEKAATPGRVTVVPGSSGATAWTGSAKGATGVKPGFMSSGTDNLTNALMIGYTIAAPSYVPADIITTPGGLVYTNVTVPTGVLNFCAKQVMGTETVLGNYSVIITFTASLSSP